MAGVGTVPAPPAPSRSPRRHWPDASRCALLAHYDAGVRTTLTLDPDVERLVRDAMHRQRRSMKEIVNDGLRQGLIPPDRPRRRYRLVAHRSALRAGFDRSSLNRLADEVEDEVLAERLASRG